MIGERELLGPLEVVPTLDTWRTEWRCRLELVPAVARSAALGCDRTGHHRNEEQTASDLPAAHVSGPCCTPVVRRELGRMSADDRRDLANLLSRNASDVLGSLRRVLGVVLLERGSDRSELVWHVGELFGEEGFPVHPALDELFVPGVIFEHLVDDRQAQERFGARPCR